VGEREDVVADAAAVGVVDGAGEVGLVVEQAVDDVRRLAGGRDGDGVERRVAGRDVGVDVNRIGNGTPDRRATGTPLSLPVMIWS
jgi:hypothetical protein